MGGADLVQVAVYDQAALASRFDQAVHDRTRLAVLPRFTPALATIRLPAPCVVCFVLHSRTLLGLWLAAARVSSDWPANTSSRMFRIADRSGLGALAHGHTIAMRLQPVGVEIQGWGWGVGWGGGRAPGAGHTSAWLLTK